MCAINVEELWRGARHGEEESIRRLLQGLEMAPLGRREGEQAGTWRREFSAAEVTLSQADCLVAAAALGVGAWLIRVIWPRVVAARDRAEEIARAKGVTI